MPLTDRTIPAVEVAARFGENLARCRRHADLSQEELSVRASLHRTEISQLERGLRLARIDTLVKLAGALEVEATALLEGIEWSPGRTTAGQFRLETPVAADARLGRAAPQARVVSPTRSA